MVLLAATMQSFNFIPNSGILDTIFHQTWLRIAIFGFPSGGYKVTLIGLIILTILALTANAITERLTGKKVGMLGALLITILGAYIFITYVSLPFDFAVEGILLGAVVISVFYVLIKGQASGKK
jgi:prepilin signal peptidase PulO-like enzyme (type II secretory pathway)